MRTVVVEFRRSLEDSSAEKAGHFFTDVDFSLELAFRMLTLRFPDLQGDAIEEVKSQVMDVVKGRFTHHFPTTARMTAKDAETMSRLLKNVVDSAERYRKIFDNVMIKMEYDAALMKVMRDFLQNRIMPFILPEHRPAAAEATLKFLPAMTQAVQQYDQEG